MTACAQDLANAVARKRAQHDAATLGYFNNRYPVGSPEHAAYDDFANAHRRAVGRALRIIKGASPATPED